jgi:hypothetical protein
MTAATPIASNQRAVEILVGDHQLNGLEARTSRLSKSIATRWGSAEVREGIENHSRRWTFIPGACVGGGRSLGDQVVASPLDVSE